MVLPPMCSSHQVSCSSSVLAAEIPAAISAVVIVSRSLAASPGSNAKCLFDSGVATYGWDGVGGG
jgi:hypothetical protein